MRVLVAILLLIGFGLLGLSSVTGSSTWAWVSAGVSVAAVAILVIDWRRKSTEESGDGTGNGLAPEEDLDGSVAASPSAPSPADEPPSDATSTDPDGVSAYISQDSGAGPGTAGYVSAVREVGASGPAEPLSEGEPVSGEPERGQRAQVPTAEHSGENASDATLVFARVTADGADVKGAVDRGELATPQVGLEHADAPVSTAGLDLADEVLVVDEQPRYHLLGCCSLGGLETIAITAHEAVDLEFIPCEACIPVRKLSLVASRRREQSGPTG